MTSLLESFNKKILAPYIFVIVLGFVLRMAIDGREEELGFHLEKQKSMRIGQEVLTHFTDDIALISMEINRAPRDATKGVSKCLKSGHENKFRKFMSYNQQDAVTIRTN